MNTSFSKKLTASVLIGTLFLTGCATPGGDQAAAGGDPCNPKAAALGGAVLGGLIASAKNTNVVGGAAIGGAVGVLACMVINAHSRQVKSAELVEQDYRRKQGSLPASPTVVSYTNQLSPGPKQTVAPGGAVKSVSHLEVVRGKDVPIHDVSETLVVYDIDGNEIKRFTKVFTESSPGSGGFENTFDMTMPSSAPQGIYKFKTEVAVNGQAMREAGGKVEVTYVQEDTRVVAAR